MGDVEKVVADFREFFDRAARPSEANRAQFDRYIAEMMGGFGVKVEQLEGDVIEEENRANENATLVHEARAERDARIRVLDCNAADIHADAHVWDFGSGEHFVCFGNQRDHRPDCPALHSPDMPERCRCVFLDALDREEGK